MKYFLVLVTFCFVAAVCSLPLAFAATRMRTSFFLGGYYGTDAKLLGRLWLYFALLMVAGGWLQIPPRAR